MKKYIMKMFNVKGVIVDSLRIENDIEISIRSPLRRVLCPHCEASCWRVYDRKIRKVVHGRLNSRNIVLVVKQRRFRCLCGNIFTEKVCGITRKRYSAYFQNQCLHALKDSNFKTVTTAYAISSPTLVSFLKEKKLSLNIPLGDLKLNVDEHSFSGRDMKITVGEVNNKRVLAVLRDDRQETLRTYIASLTDEEKSRVSEVCIDMRAGYLSVLKKELPHSLIVVDHFHVVKEMIRQCDEIRRILQPSAERGWKRINRWLLIKNREDLAAHEQRELTHIFKRLEAFPALKQCYLTKEMIRDMYRSKTKALAEKKLEHIILILEALPLGIPREMCDTLKRWKPYILNYFESKTTNSFIEGCHNKIKLIKRMSYGFRNFNNYVMKITLAFLPFLLETIHTKL